MVEKRLTWLSQKKLTWTATVEDNNNRLFSLSVTILSLSGKLPSTLFLETNMLNSEGFFFLFCDLPQDSTHPRHTMNRCDYISCRLNVLHNYKAISQGAVSSPLTSADASWLNICNGLHKLNQVLFFAEERQVTEKQLNFVRHGNNLLISFRRDLHCRERAKERMSRRRKILFVFCIVNCKNRGAERWKLL